MNAMQIVVVGLRLLGVYVVIQVLKTLTTGFQVYSQFAAVPDVNFKLLVAAYLFQALLFAAAAFVLLKFPGLLARRLLKGSFDEIVAKGANPSNLLDVGFCLMGVYILSWAVPDLIFNALEIYRQSNNEHYHQDQVSYLLVSEIVTLIEIGIGAYLALQSRGLRELLWRIRGSKLQKPPPRKEYGDR